MRRFLFSAFLIFLIVLGVATFIVWSQRAVLLSDFLSHKVGFPVRIENVGVSPFSLTLQRLELKPLTESSAAITFRIEEIRVKMSLWELLENPISIQEVMFIKPFVEITTYTQETQESDVVQWMGLAKEFNKISSKPHSNPQNGEEKKFRIQRLIMHDASLHVHNTFLKKDLLKVTNIPSIELTNIGNADPLPIKKIFEIVFRTLLEKASQKQVPEKLLDKALDQLKKEGEKRLPFLKELFKKPKEEK